jgi:hypothetical protein
MEFRIDLAKTFETLPKAPIVEAVIHWRARPTVSLNSSSLRQKLQDHLTEYAEPQNTLSRRNSTNSRSVQN